MVSGKVTEPFVGGAIPRAVAIDMAINPGRECDYAHSPAEGFRHSHGRVVRPKKH